MTAQRVTYAPPPQHPQPLGVWRPRLKKGEHKAAVDRNMVRKDRMSEAQTRRRWQERERDIKPQMADAEVAIALLNLSRAGVFGLDGKGRPPGIWMESLGLFRIGNSVASQWFGPKESRGILSGSIVPKLFGFDGVQKPVASVEIVERRKGVRV